MAKKRIYGLLAEFESADELLSAAHRTREAGYHRIDAFSPMPVEGLAEAVGFHSSRLPLVVLRYTRTSRPILLFLGARPYFGRRFSSQPVFPWALGSAHIVGVALFSIRCDSHPYVSLGIFHGAKRREGGVLVHNS